MEPRYHCDQEMEYLGLKEKEHWFECIQCNVRESTLDPEKPTTPLERPRKSLREYGTETIIGKSIYHN